jgi:hypothetical protein
VGPHHSACFQATEGFLQAPRRASGRSRLLRCGLPRPAYSSAYGSKGIAAFLDCWYTLGSQKGLEMTNRKWIMDWQNGQNHVYITDHHGNTVDLTLEDFVNIA